MNSDAFDRPSSSISVSFVRGCDFVDVSDLPVGEVVVIRYNKQEHLCLKVWTNLVSLSDPNCVWREDGKVDVVRHVKKLEIKEVT